MRLLRAPLVCLLVVFWGCGGGCSGIHTLENPDIQRSVYIEIDAVALFPDRTWVGLSIPFEASPQQIKIRSGLTATNTHRVVAHELLHAAGYGTHIPKVGPDCYFHSDGAMGSPLGPPCPAEVDKIRKVTRQFTVVVQDPSLLTAVIWATSMWNEAAGRTVFIVDL